jgi:thiamine-phosphate pyrophosphorylase
LIAGLYAIADTSVVAAARLIASVTAALEGGARLVQLRDKGALGVERFSAARQLSDLCRTHGALFIVNDDIELARAVHAHGVHIGRDDASLIAARSRLGPDAIIGVSCYNDLERALAAEAAGADYVAFGSFYPSATKPEAVRADTTLLRRARMALHCPIVAIGGITPENGGDLIAAGADALAVIQGVFGQQDIAAAARRFNQLFQNKP